MNDLNTIIGRFLLINGHSRSSFNRIEECERSRIT